MERRKIKPLHFWKCLPVECEVVQQFFLDAGEEENLGFPVADLDRWAEGFRLVDEKVWDADEDDDEDDANADADAGADDRDDVGADDRDDAASDDDDEYDADDRGDASDDDDGKYDDDV